MHSLPLTLLVGIALILTGCTATRPALNNTLPDEVKNTFSPVPDRDGIAFEFIPSAAGESIEVTVKAMDHPLNRVLKGMVTEMLETKFDSIRTSSSNRLRVTLNYINLQEESFGESINRMDMGILVELVHGEERIAEEFEHTVQANVEGYTLHSGQIYDMMLRFILDIDRMTDAAFSSP